MNYQKEGYSLLELLLAISIFIIVLGAVTGFAVFYFRTYSFSFDEQLVIGQAQTGMTAIIRELREARTSETGSWPLEQLDDTSIIFYSDVTNDGRTDRVRYFLDGNDLKRGVIEPIDTPVSYPLENEQIRTICTFVDTEGLPLFTYYNGNWPNDTVNNPLLYVNRLLATRFVSVYLRINLPSDTGSVPFELTSSVQIRSLKDNL